MTHQNLNNSQRRIIFVLIFIIGVIIINKVYLCNQLKVNELNSSGKIIKLTSGGTAGGVHFTFPENKKVYNPVMTITWPSCRKLILENMQELRKHTFPVVYAKNNTNNAEILIFRDQYDKFELNVPIAIEEIVDRLSKCKK